MSIIHSLRRFRDSDTRNGQVGSGPRSNVILPTQFFVLQQHIGKYLGLTTSEYDLDEIHLKKL